MIALALVAIGLIALLGLGNRSMGVGERVQRMTTATLLAQQKMTELELADAAGNVLQPEQGNFASPFELFHWRTEYRETPLATVRRVDVIVVWGNERRNEAVALTSFLFGRGGGA
jgi:general secretion pathway protein I